MGVFRDFIAAFKEGYNGSSGEDSSNGSIFKPWGYKLKGFIDIDGDSERAIYVYDGRPLAGVRKGQIIPIETYCGDCRMTSIYTGMEWDSAEMGDAPVMYRDQVIGFTTIPREKVLEAAKLGYALRFKAKCMGMLEGYDNVKEIKMIAPKPFYLYGLVPDAADDRPLRDREYYFSYNEYDEDDFANIAKKDEWTFPDARLEMIPTPTKSSAKPHIGVYSNDGMLVSEVAAKNKYYSSMIDFMSRYKNFSVKATRRKSDINGAIFYTIEIYGK